MPTTKKKPLRIDRNRDCHLFAVSGHVPSQLVVLLIVRELAEAIEREPGKPEWLVFSGVQLEHWAAMSTWVLVSDVVPSAVVERIKRSLAEAIEAEQFEANELCRPASDPRLVPVFRVAKSSVELLVPPEQYDHRWRGTLDGVPTTQRPYSVD